MSLNFVSEQKRRNEFGGMWMDPKRKRKLGPPAPSIEKIQTVDGVKTYTAIWPHKSQVAHATSGDIGSKYKKKHFRAAQTAGFGASGAHDSKLHAKGRCRCARFGCNPNVGYASRVH
jgi:hypothetical protein